MKVCTRHRENVVTETKEKFERAKQPEYRLRKWLGNTLLPVVIGLAVSGVATVAFLNQGGNLIRDNKVILAKNELTQIMSVFSELRTQYALDDIVASPPNPPSNVQIYPEAIIRTNVFGYEVSYKRNSARIIYKTPSSDICDEIALFVGNMEFVKMYVNNVTCGFDDLGPIVTGLIPGIQVPSGTNIIIWLK